MLFEVCKWEAWMVVVNERWKPPGPGPSGWRDGGLWRSKGTPDMTGQGDDLKFLYWSWPNFK